MKKSRLLPIGLLALFPFIASPILISCRNNPSENNNSPESDEIILTNFINNIKPTLKVDKENVKPQTLASSIQTEENVENWYDNLPQSQDGINVSFAYTSADDKKGILNIIYIIKKNDIELRYTKTDNGFQIRTKTQDQIDVENFINKLSDPVIKENKKSEQANTPAENIRTEKEVMEWFDGLWNSNNIEGIQVSFLKTETNSNNSLVAKDTLRVYYQIQKGDYSTNVYWETSGFQIDSSPVIPPSTGYTKFKISLKRSNGKLLENYYPTILFYKDQNTNNPEEKWFSSAVNEFELPTGTYKCVIQSKIPNGMEVNEEFTISEQNPSYDIIFTPKNLQNESTPENYNYELNDVLFQSEYTDVNDNKVKLSDNIQNNKVTLFMFFKIDCPYCAAMENEIAKLKDDPNFKDRFEVWTFSGHDSKERLKGWSSGFKSFKVFYDENFVVRKHFDNTTTPQTGVPKFYFVDQQGVLVSKTQGQINNLKDYLLELFN